MPNRIIREALLDSHRYAELSTEAKLLFHHLLLLADDFGCINVGESFLRRRAFYDGPSGQKIAKLLTELIDTDLVRTYEVNRACYAFIPRFRQKLQTMKLKHPEPPSALVQDDEDAVKKFRQIQRVSAGEEVLSFGKEWENLRRLVFTRDGDKCIRCSASDSLTAHHLTPKSKGGVTSIENLATLCMSCNAWARNNDSRCLEIKNLFTKTVSGQHLARNSRASSHVPEVKRREEKRSEVKESKPLASSDVPSDSPVALIPLVGQKQYPVYKTFLEELENAYPDVDGPATLLEIRAWCLANPTRCKTERGVARFINSWFERTQNA